MMHCINIDGSAPEKVIFSGHILNIADLHAYGTTPEQIIATLYRKLDAGGLQKLSGPFVAAITDAQGNVILARDPFGQKQLYYSCKDNILRFSESLSELITPQMSTDMQAIADYLSLGYIPAPRTIKKEVHSLAPGHIARFAHNASTRQIRYFTPQFFPKTTLSFHEACEGVDALLTQAVQRCLNISQAPGVLLSGGIDSNLMLYYTNSQMKQPPQAFTLYVDDAAYNESDLATISAQAINSPHHKLKANAEDVFKMQAILKAAGQPFGDSSLLASSMIMEYASQHCRAVIMGDGGDELFGGYKRYQFMAIRDALGKPLTTIGRPFAHLLSRMLPQGKERRTMWSSIHRMTDAFTMPLIPCYGSFQEIFSQDASLALCPALRECTPYLDEWEKLAATLGTEDQAEMVNGIDLCTYLPEDGCRKDNTAAQLAGMTALSPLLDIDLAHFAFSLPRHYKTSIVDKKKPLRYLSKGRIPEMLLHQPKRGFSIPVGSWFRHELKDLALSLPNTLPDYFDKAAVQRLVDAHLTGKADYGTKLWILMTLTTNY